MKPAWTVYDGDDLSLAPHLKVIIHEDAHPKEGTVIAKRMDDVLNCWCLLVKIEGEETRWIREDLCEGKIQVRAQI